MIIGFLSSMSRSEKTDADRILQELGTLTAAVQANRHLLNNLVDRTNALEAEVQLVRQEVRSQRVSIAGVEDTLRFLTAQRRGKLTPLPELADKESTDAP